MRATMMDIDSIIRLSSEPDTLLQEVRDGDEVIQVRECDGLRWIYTGGQTLLSAFHPTAPEQLVFPNHRYMLGALLACRKPRATLNLGFGAGSFERYFRHYLPEVEIVSVDSSAVLVELARQWFGISREWPVLLEDAFAYLRRQTQRFDLILCDIFSAGGHASCLYQTDFYVAARGGLGDDGVLSLNLSPESDRDLVQILLAVRESFEYVLLTPVSDHGNVVALASGRPFPDGAELLSRARVSRAALGVDLTEVVGDFNLLPRRE